MRCTEGPFNAYSMCHLRLRPMILFSSTLRRFKPYSSSSYIPSPRFDESQFISYVARFDPPAKWIMKMCEKRRRSGVYAWTFAKKKTPRSTIRNKRDKKQGWTWQECSFYTSGTSARAFARIHSELSCKNSTAWTEVSKISRWRQRKPTRRARQLIASNRRIIAGVSAISCPQSVWHR